MFCRLLEVSFKSLTLRKLKGRMTKVIRFLYVYRSLESLLSKRPIYIQIRALALAFQLARAPPARCKGCATEVSKSLREDTGERRFSCISSGFLGRFPGQQTIFAVFFREHGEELRTNNTPWQCFGRQVSKLY